MKKTLLLLSAFACASALASEKNFTFQNLSLTTYAIYPSTLPYSPQQVQLSCQGTVISYYPSQIHCDVKFSPDSVATTASVKFVNLDSGKNCIFYFSDKQINGVWTPVISTQTDKNTLNCSTANDQNTIAK